MLRCHDPRLTYLNDLGYNVVRLPRKGINPLGVLGRDGKSLSYLGTLDQIWRVRTRLQSPAIQARFLISTALPPAISISRLAWIF